jgi:hypothetical protein
MLLDARQVVSYRFANVVAFFPGRTSTRTSAVFVPRAE